jgi:hypothetical protein
MQFCQRLIRGTRLRLRERVLYRMPKDNAEPPGGGVCRVLHGVGSMAALPRPSLRGSP